MDPLERSQSALNRRRLLARGLGATAVAGLAGPIASASAQEPPLTLGWINVKDPLYGAVGDGSTDDTAPIQAAIAAAEEAGGGPVYLPPGTYLITGITFGSNVELFGAGMHQSILKVSPAAGMFPLAVADGINGNSNIHLHDFAIDGNKANIAGDPDVLAAPGNAVYFVAAAGSYCSNIVVERLHVHDSKRLGIQLTNCRGFAIRDCLVENNDRDAITVYNDSSHGLIEGNRISGCSDDYIALNSEAGAAAMLHHVTVRGNIMRGPGDRDMGGGTFKGRGMSVRGGDHILIEGNIFDSISSEGLRVGDFEGVPLTWIQIVNNDFTNIGALARAGEGKTAVIVHAGWATWHRSLWGHVAHVLVEGNTIDDPRNDGIVVRSGHANGELHDVTVAGNKIDSPIDGINVGGSGFNVTDARIEGNTVRGASGNGIVGVTTGNARFFVNNNSVYNGAAMAIRLEGIAGGSCIGNSAYDAQGKPTQTHGIRVRGATGSWQVGGNVAFGNTRANHDYGSAGFPTF